MKLRLSVLLTSAAMLLVAACGGEVAPADTDATADDDAPTEEASADVDLSVGSSELGDHLVDAEGRTVYLFTEDPQGESVCTGDCLATWPAVTVGDDPVVGEGVDDGLVDTITREDDGTTQLTYDGQPLYLFVSDEAPGDATGQGANDVWFVVAPDGAPIMDVADDAEDDGDEEEGRGGY